MIFDSKEQKEIVEQAMNNASVVGRSAALFASTLASVQTAGIAPLDVQKRMTEPAPAGNNGNAPAPAPATSPPQ